MGMCEENVSQIVEDVDNLSCPCDGLKNNCRDSLNETKRMKDKNAFALLRIDIMLGFREVKF
jgi:hypothetical protein